MRKLETLAARLLLITVIVPLIVVCVFGALLAGSAVLVSELLEAREAWLADWRDAAR
jgi:hypothetical protein